MSEIIKILSQKIVKNADKITDFFAQKNKLAPALFYNSVDLRHSGFKVAPVDTNCFSAGFNNLSPASREFAKQKAAEFLKNNFPTTKNILLLPENHTRNLRYLENVLALQEILGENVVVGSLIEDLQENLVIDLENGSKITLQPLKKVGDKIVVLNGFIPDLIVLNNDLTDGIPAILQDLSIPIVPSLKLGWYERTKSNHFKIYNELAEELAQILEIDSWLISSMHRSCLEVDFKAQVGIECLARYVDELITKLKQKYQQYGIDEEPYCFIKADNGTYGMAVWPVFSGAEVLEINKKERNKMNMLKGSIQNTRVMIQEGIKTIDKIDGKVAEPMIYLVNGEVVGNLFRVNESRDEKISLNASGMSFCDLSNLQESQVQLGSTKGEATKVYELIAKLAALAAAFE